MQVSLLWGLVELLECDLGIKATCVVSVVIVIVVTTGIQIFTSQLSLLQSWLVSLLGTHWEHRCLCIFVTSLSVNIPDFGLREDGVTTTALTSLHHNFVDQVGMLTLRFLLCTLLTVECKFLRTVLCCTSWCRSNSHDHLTIRVIVMVSETSSSSGWRFDHS